MVRRETNRVRPYCATKRTVLVSDRQARIRIQLSAGHEKAHLDKAIAAFIKVGKELGVI